MKPPWINKTDPVKHPVRFLAVIWQERLQRNFGIEIQFRGKEYGQLKKLRECLGDLTQHVIEWMLNPVNWWQFCQRVKAESGLLHVPSDFPHLGFLLKQHKRAVKIMREKLKNSTDPADISFCTKLDQEEFSKTKALAYVFAEGKPQLLAKIEAAETLTDINLVFVEIVDSQKIDGAY
jgi:hypothetical protein